jgi:phage gp36-like protein
VSLITDAELLALGLASASLPDVSSTVRDLHRATASALVESRLARRYRLPLQEVGADVKLAVAMVASYTLLAYRGYRPTPGAPDEIRQRYDAAMEWLEMVVDGRAELRGEVAIMAPLVASDEPRWHRDMVVGRRTRLR